MFKAMSDRCLVGRRPETAEGKSQAHPVPRSDYLPCASSHLQQQLFLDVFVPLEEQ